MFLASAIFATVIACGSEKNESSLKSDRDYVLGQGTAKLKSTEGIKLDLDWKMKYLNRSSNKPLSYVVLDQMEITVKENAENPLPKDSAVRVMVISKMEKKVGCGQNYTEYYEVPFELDLERQEDGTYKADMFKSGIYYTSYGNQQYKNKARRLNLQINGYCDTHKEVSTELAFVVNGVWQKDPINKSNNFVLRFN